MARKRGSLVDAITLTEFLFQFEPKVSEKNSTQYAKQFVIGKRLPQVSWIGGGEADVELDIFLLGTETALGKVQDFKNFLLAQTDSAAPHPVFINVGDMYVGHVFLMTHCEVDPVTYEYADSMRPNEVKLKMKFTEFDDNTLSGASLSVLGE